MNHSLSLKLHEDIFAVCQLEADEMIPGWVNESKWFSITKTDNELSVVCQEDVVPDDVKVEPGWRMFEVVGPLDFSMVGVLAELSAVMKAAGISIYVVSTYDTDYLMVKEEKVKEAKRALINNGINVDVI